MNELDVPIRPYVGDVIDGKYELVKLLGEGGFGVVFEAKHLLLKDKFALKFHVPKNNIGRMERPRFIREAQSARRIKSEYSVHVSDMGTFFKPPRNDEFLYIVMEHLEGMDLYGYAEMHHPLGIETCIDFILQACIALAKAHAMKITHRDLKPSNLFLTTQDGLPRVKVLDFGLAKDGSPGVSPDARTRTTDDCIGTPGYSPPEQYNDFKNPTPAGDIFSLAASLYFILTREDPFPGSGHVAIANVLHGSLIPIRSVRTDVPIGLAKVIEKALANAPVDRHGSIVEFAQGLVPFGDLGAAERLAAIDRAAKSGAILAERIEAERIEAERIAAERIEAERIEENKLTTKFAPLPAPVTDELPTVPFNGPKATESIMRPQPPHPQQYPTPAPRQTNSRIIIVIVALVIVLTTGIGLAVTAIFGPVPDPAPSASAESTAPKPIDPAPSATAFADTKPATSASSKSSGSPPVEKPAPKTKATSTNNERTF